MKTKNKKKSIIKKILAFSGAIFCSIVCAFSLFNYTDTKSMEVSADEIITTNSVFNGSPLIIPTSYYNYFYNSNDQRQLFLGPLQSYYYSTDADYSTWYRYLYSLFNVSFRTNQDSGELEFMIECSSINLVNGSDNSYVNSYEGFQYSFPYSYINHVERSSINNYYYDSLNSWLPLSRYADGVDLVISDNYIHSRTIDGIVVEVSKSSTDIVVSNMTHCTISSSISSDRTRYIVTYYDSNSSYVAFKFSNGFSKYSFPSRTYYFNNNYNFTDNEYYNQGYSAGQSTGYDSGYSAGETAGYSSGYNTGKDDGYWQGYNQALENDDRYSFTSLITSVIDVPVQTFTSLFNFEILGVNLSGFLLGLFTLSVAIFIIKLII